MPPLVDCLEQLVKRMEKISPSSLCLLQKGLKESEIDTIAKILGYQFSDEVYELYTWHNGMVYDVQDTRPYSFIHPYSFNPLGVAIRNSSKIQKSLLSDEEIEEEESDLVYEEIWGSESIYEDILEDEENENQEEDDEEPLWLPNWVSIFSSEEPLIYLCTVCSNEKYKSTPVVKIDIECADAVVQYDSLTSMIQTYVEYFESKRTVSFENIRRKYNSTVLRDPYSLKL